MFEQTLLTHPASARKTGALAASFLAQSSLLGVLLIGPLLYTRVLPVVQIPAPLWIPELRVTPPPVIQSESRPNGGAARGLGRVFVAPTHIPTGRIATEVVIDSGRGLIDDTIVVAVPGTNVGPTMLPALVEALPVVEIPKPPPVQEVKPVRVSSTILAAKLIKRVVPTYPALARTSRMSGTVHLLGIVSKDGRVENLRVLDGPPLLRQAALDAVRQWAYSPTILNGQPVEIEAPIEVNFTLN